MPASEFPAVERRDVSAIERRFDKIDQQLERLIDVLKQQAVQGTQIAFHAEQLTQHAAQLAAASTKSDLMAGTLATLADRVETRDRNLRWTIATVIAAVAAFPHVVSIIEAIGDHIHTQPSMHP